MATNWRMKKSSDGAWTNVRMVSFDSEEQIEAKDWVLQGRGYRGVSHGSVSGLKAAFEILVLDAATDTAVMDILTSRENIDLEGSLGESWVVRVVSNVRRNQVLAASTGGPYPVAHQFFLSGTVVEVA